MLWWLSHEEGRDAVHDVVGINCKKAATTENQGSGVSSIWAKGCILMTVWVFYLT